MDYLPFALLGMGIDISDSVLVLGWCSIWLRMGEINGTGLEAARVLEIFPLEMTYIVQKSGIPFDTLPGISFLLNLQSRNIREIRN